ncbi:MAG: 4'-phosphopantetheinyl transferase superfamily protein [Nitrospiraceae bacterium]|nr:4'-phosphopantetheinyl transferase superfamily protein [Nitrospiraceae bacterium]
MPGRTIAGGDFFTPRIAAADDGLELKKGEAHIWRVSLEMPDATAETLRQGLSADELERAARFRFPSDRDHYIVARGVLRGILAGYLNTKPEKIRFRYGPFGKPELAGDAREMPRFSVSHSHGLALCAVALERKIGVDIEYMRRRVEAGDIARQFLSRQDNSMLKKCPRHKRQKAFFMLWTRKEAYLKARGTGLAEDPAPCETDRDAPWSLTDLRVERGYAAAVAVEGRCVDLLCRQWVSGAPRI